MSDHHEVEILSDKKLTITLPDSADGATFTFKPNEVEELTIVQQPCGDCARLRELILGGQWTRQDGRTYLSVRVPDGSDLSCRATREDALRAALAPAEKPGEEAGDE